MSKVARALLIAVALIVAVAPRAFAHGEKGFTNPEAGAKLPKVPKSVTVGYTEPPTGDARFEVTDGCDRDVVKDLKIQNNEIKATLAGGQPGKWNVSWKIVSGLDGHPSNDGYKFEVAGDRDCNQEPDPQETSDGAAAGGAGDEGSSGSSIPWVPIAIGSVALIAVATLVRRSGS